MAIAIGPTSTGVGPPPVLSPLELPPSPVLVTSPVLATLVDAAVLELSPVEALPVLEDDPPPELTSPVPTSPSTHAPAIPAGACSPKRRPDMHARSANEQ